MEYAIYIPDTIIHQLVVSRLMCLLNSCKFIDPTDEFYLLKYFRCLYNWRMYDSNIMIARSRGYLCERLYEKIDMKKPNIFTDIVSSDDINTLTKLFKYDTYYIYSKYNNCVLFSELEIYMSNLNCLLKLSGSLCNALISFRLGGIQYYHHCAKQKHCSPY